MPILRTLLLAVAVAVQTVAAAVPPVAITIQHRFTSAPGYFRVRVTIESDDRNRWACLYAIPVARGDQVTHCWQLDDRSPHTFWHELKNLPVGKYEAVATVERNDQHTLTSNRILLRVMGVGEDPEPEL